MKSEILMLQLFFVRINKVYCHNFEKIFRKSPGGFNALNNASIFNPHTLRNEKVAVVQSRLNLLLTHLENQKILSTTQYHKMTEQFLKFIDQFFPISFKMF